MSNQIIRVLSTKYDGSPRDEWPARLLGVESTCIRLHVPAGTEEIVAGTRRSLITDAYTALYWTDRWYNVWQFERTDGLLFYANVSMPCTFDGSTLRWVDLDIDILQYADGFVVVKDEQEFALRRESFAYPPEVVDNAVAARDKLLQLAKAGNYPFCR